MGYIRRHKLATFIILVYIIVVGFAYFLYKLFIGSSGLPVYGDRLDGIENVPITEEQINKIEENMKEVDFVLKVTKPYLNGKILKVIITVSDLAGLDPAKKLSSKITEVLTEDQLNFYDIEFYVKKLYNCTLEATGKMDEDGNFLEDVVVKFDTDLTKNEFVEDFGLSTSKDKVFNKEQEFKIEKDGEYVIYGVTQDKMGPNTCSIKITKKTGDENSEDAKEETVNSITTRAYPIIGYKKYGKKDFVWSK